MYLSNPQHIPTTSLHVIDEGRDASTGLIQPDLGSVFSHTAQPPDFETHEHEQMFYDNFWTSYLDNAFDVDLLIHPN